ncbi:MAG: hypothetical protein M3008_09570 [Chloroflexota bacterium]|nr:hypothetical protein [Chloroflexota bacterium]
MRDDRAGRLIAALLIGIAAGSFILTTATMILVGFGAVAVMPAHGYRVGGLLAGLLGLVVGGAVARWAYRRGER